METVEEHHALGGIQGVYRHQSAVTDCEMTFAVFRPPQAAERPCPVLWYLSGLTCTHANVMEKGEYRRAAAEHGIIIVCPDTSPRGEDVPDIDDYRLGKGAGFYLTASEAPWNRHYRMDRYILDDLSALVAQEFSIDPERQGIFGHSMGGHGALTMALKNSDRFRSCSAFAPIVAPSEVEWAQMAFGTYLGADEATWADYDTCALIAAGARFPGFLVDQGDADAFLESGLRPWRLTEECEQAGIPLTLRMPPGYDHSYYFISTFMADHIAWHAERLAE